MNPRAQAAWRAMRRRLPPRVSAALGVPEADVRAVLTRRRAHLLGVLARTFPPDALGGIVGDAVEIVHPGRRCPGEHAAAFRLVEVSRLIPSHDPHSFAPHPAYPAGVQERRYHKDKAEQQKVLDNSHPDCFNPALLANTDPTALGGTPIATSAGVVLGGNSRTMVLQRIAAAAGPAQARHLAYLRRFAHQFGLSPDALHTFDAPAVARVVRLPDATPALLKDLVRRFNEPLTQHLDRIAEQVATSQRLDDAVLAHLEDMELDETLNAFLTSPRSTPFVRSLINREVIPKARVGRLMAPGGLLNDDGRRFVARALVGRVLPDPDALDLLTPSLRNSLARAVPFILLAATVHQEHPERWDVRRVFPQAVRIWSRARHAKLPSVRHLADQAELVDAHIDRLTTANLLLATVLDERAGPLQLSGGFRAFAQAANQANTPDLFGVEPTPVEAFARAFKLEVPRAKSVVAVEDFRGLETASASETR